MYSDKLKDTYENVILNLKRRIENLEKYKIDKKDEYYIKEGLYVPRDTTCVNIKPFSMSSTVISKNSISWVNECFVDEDENLVGFIFHDMDSMGEVKLFLINTETEEEWLITLIKNSFSLSYSCILACDTTNKLVYYTYSVYPNSYIVAYNYITKTKISTIPYSGVSGHYYIKNGELHCTGTDGTNIFSKKYDTTSSAWIDNTINNTNTIAEMISNSYDDIIGTPSYLIIKDSKVEFIAFIGDDMFLYKYRVVHGAVERLELSYKVPLCDGTYISYNDLGSGVLHVKDENYYQYIDLINDFYYTLKLNKKVYNVIAHGIHGLVTLTVDKTNYTAITPEIVKIDVPDYLTLNIIASDTEPTDPTINDIWIDTSEE